MKNDKDKKLKSYLELANEKAEQKANEKLAKLMAEKKKNGIGSKLATLFISCLGLILFLVIMYCFGTCVATH